MTVPWSIWDAYQKTAQHIQINLGSTSKHTGYNIHIPKKKIQVV